MTWRGAARLAGLLVGLACGAVPLAARAQEAAPKPEPEDAVIFVAPVARGDTILVSFTVAKVVTPSIEQAIESGLPTTFTYDVELRRASFLWFDKLMASARIAATVRFDALTRRYHVTILQDGRVAEERATDRPDEVRRWVSVFERLPLFTTRELIEQTVYDVHVRGRTTPRRTWSFWPWARPSAHGSAGFTFVP